MTGPIDIGIVEDNVLIAEPLRLYLEAKGWVARVAGDFDEAEEMVRTREPNCVLLDLRLGDRDGADLIPIIREARPGAAIIVCSGEVQARRLSGVDLVYVKAESDFDQLIAAIPPPRGTRTDESGSHSC